MSTKLLERAEVKAAVLNDVHEIDFYALAFSKKPDNQGDRIAPTAADDWLKRFYAKGSPLPISFTHSAVRDTADPENYIGHAPADPDHVFKDAYGLRVRGVLYTNAERRNDKAIQAYFLTKDGVITGASVAYVVPPGGEKRQSDGSMLITKMDIIEAGPCLEPANPDAYVISVKANEAKELDEEAKVNDRLNEIETKALDDSPWEKDRAMGECSSAADYGSICAGERDVGDPDQRQHWALPHHYLGRGANAAGVAAARARFDQTQGLTNKEAARTHLFETHQLPSDSAKAEGNGQSEQKSSATVTVPLDAWNRINTKAGREISSKNEAKIRQMHDLAHDLLTSLSDEVTQAKDEEPQRAKSDGEVDSIRDLIAAQA